MEAGDYSSLVRSKRGIVRAMSDGALTMSSRSIAIGLFLSLMDTTIISTMLYTISDEFDGFKSCSWIVLAYTLSYVGEYPLLALLFSRHLQVIQTQDAPYSWQDYLMSLAGNSSCACAS